MDGILAGRSPAGVLVEADLQASCVTWGTASPTLAFHYLTVNSKMRPCYFSVCKPASGLMVMTFCFMRNGESER